MNPLYSLVEASLESTPQAKVAVAVVAVGTCALIRQLGKATGVASPNAVVPSIVPVVPGTSPASSMNGSGGQVTASDVGDEANDDANWSWLEIDAPWYFNG